MRFWFDTIRLFHEELRNSNGATYKKEKYFGGEVSLEKQGDIIEYEDHIDKHWSCAARDEYFSYWQTYYKWMLIIVPDIL